MCHSVDSAVMLTGQHNQYSGTINLVAQSTLRQDPHPGSQQASTINTLSAPSLVWPSQHSGTLNPPAQATLRLSQHSGTIIISAQSPFWLNIAAESALQHNQPFGTFIILAQSTFRHNQQFGIIIHQQPNKFSEQLKKSGGLRSAILRHFQIFSDILRCVVGQLFRSCLF